MTATRRLWVAITFLMLSSAPVGAVMDIEDDGPALRAGRFAMRVTNVGVIGNAFYNTGLSNDPSFEYPTDSGQELMDHAELWVGALDFEGVPRVSGGPALEWRPTLDPDDRVREVWHGRLGTRRNVDDDGDGRIDEEVLNHRDDDHDGEIDEDLGVSSQQLLAAEYGDSEPASVYYAYPNGEQHHPLGLSVRQESYAWAVPGYENIAGFQFTITNRGTSVLRMVYVGLYADLDSRGRNDPSGHLNDRVETVDYRRAFPAEMYRVMVRGNWYPSASSPFNACVESVADAVPAVRDGRFGSALPYVAVVPLGHTTDPLDRVDARLARAPAQHRFRKRIFWKSGPTGRGAVPILDAERYEAMAVPDPLGTTPPDRTDDYTVLVSCGPFRTLQPGESIEFAVALVAADTREGLSEAMANAATLYRGVTLNLLPDSLGLHQFDWDVGETGLNGHEVCLEPPPGVTFMVDPHCSRKFDTLPPLEPMPVTYTPGECIWTDLDCDLCTGVNGKETVQRWLDPGHMPPAPALRITPGDHEVTIEWDNLPEILLAAEQTDTPERSEFLGYRIYKLTDWRDRQSLLPPRENWGLYGIYGTDSAFGATPLEAVTDTTLDYIRIRYGQRHYPPGRYRVVDRDVLNGFDYAYVVTTVSETKPAGLPGRGLRYESPPVVTFDDVVVPHAAATADGAGVWVVPNPFRWYAGWDRPRVPGDPLTRHIDFMGLPRARATIKIWTLAGDFVARIDHDGTGGDGQASWDLVSRNGQDVVSGIYLFTVDSPFGQQTGRFVIVR